MRAVYELKFFMRTFQLSDLLTDCRFVDSPAHTTFENLCSYAQHMNFLMRLSIRGRKNL